MSRQAKTKLIHYWRLQEIANIANSIVVRGSYCLIGRAVAIAQRERLLKQGTHIRLRLNPHLNLGTTKSRVRKSRGALCESDTIIAEIPDSYIITIEFNADIDTKDGWNIATKALLRELGRVIFFSQASNKKYHLTTLSTKQKSEFLEDFVDKMFERQPFAYDAVRPRFSLARLREIVEYFVDTYPSGSCANEVSEDLEKLLFPYFGPGGR